MENSKDIIIKDCDDCEYCYTSYAEWDTGYREFGCELLESDCLGEYCPLTFKYSIQE